MVGDSVCNCNCPHLISSFGMLAQICLRFVSGPPRCGNTILCSSFRAVLHWLCTWPALVLCAAVLARCLCLHFAQLAHGRHCACIG